jgi:aspartyl-tRNA(Asn)/glutamyl-tRNA(Gln) amidotransferase subunit A
MPTTIHAAAEQIRSGRLSPLDLLDQCLARIDRLEDVVRAWVLIDRDGARQQAARCADEIKRGQWRGPLHGIPIGIKDIMDVFDWPTAAGSRQWKDSIARQDATCVRRLREAGAVLVGKTATTQYASFDPSPTRNPWDPTKTPGGSSSGSAAATACGMCLGALGSQTGGSITRPASYCGVAGLKPTFGAASLRGVLPLAESMDHLGPINRCVRDLALLFQVVTGPDEDVAGATQRPTFDYEALLRRDAKPPRIGRLRGLFETRAESSVNAMMATVCARLQEKGASIVEIALPASFSEVTARHRVVMAVEAAAYHEPRLRRHPEDYGPCISSLLEEGLACPAPEYRRCKEHQRRLKEEIEGCFAAVDVLLTPATSGPAPDAATTGDPVFNSPWSYTGSPTVSFPVARTPQGLPLAVQLIGPKWSESELLAAALWCEQAIGFVMPEMQPI